MALGFSDPFDAIFRFQTALDQQLESDWLEGATTGTGAFPPINIFRQGHDFAAIIELPGVTKEDLSLEVRGKHPTHFRQEDGRVRWQCQHAPPRADRWQF